MCWLNEPKNECMFSWSKDEVTRPVSHRLNEVRLPWLLVAVVEPLKPDAAAALSEPVALLTWLVGMA